MEYSKDQLEVLKEFTNDISSIRRIHRSEFEDNEPFNPFNPFDYIRLGLKSLGMVYDNKKDKVVNLTDRYHVIFLHRDPEYLHLIPK